MYHLPPISVILQPLGAIIQTLEAIIQHLKAVMQPLANLLSWMLIYRLGCRFCTQADN